VLPAVIFSLELIQDSVHCLSEEKFIIRMAWLDAERLSDVIPG
jgi:hypothetical protein